MAVSLKTGKWQWLEPERLRFYLWVGFSYQILWWLGDSAGGSDAHFSKVLSGFWRLCYITAVNIVFFEYVTMLLGRRRIMLSLLLLIAQFLLYTFGLYFWRQLGVLLFVDLPQDAGLSFRGRVCAHVPYSLPSFFVFGISRHLYEHIKLRNTAQQLRIEKQEAELNFLKSQTHPHFLFNTLNNIYALSKEKSDLAPESILRLSEILRFMLYETGGAYIEIGEEIKIIKDYIALEALRYDASLDVNFECVVADMKQPVPPLLLIPLVENAFKHGASETRSHPFVHLKLELNATQLRFTVKNSVETQEEDADPNQEKIGLANLRRQLELLYTDYSLRINRQNQAFTAELYLNLSSHV